VNTREFNASVNEEIQRLMLSPEVSALSGLYLALAEAELAADAAQMRVTQCEQAVKRAEEKLHMRREGDK